MAEMTHTRPGDIDVYRARALKAGGLGLVSCAIGFVFDRDHFFRSLLIASINASLAAVSRTSSTAPRPCPPIATNRCEI